MSTEQRYYLTADDVALLRELKRAMAMGDFMHRPQHQRKPLPWNSFTLRCARLTEDMTDANPSATANVWEWDDGTEDWVETDTEVTLRSFLRPEGETIADRTRVFFEQVGRVLQIVVCNCSPDPADPP